MHQRENLGFLILINYDHQINYTLFFFIFLFLGVPFLCTFPLKLCVHNQQLVSLSHFHYCYCYYLFLGF